MVEVARGGRNAAALAILALSALLLTPFLFQRTIAGNRQAYTSSLDPAREASSATLLSLARQIAAIRGYLLTRDPSLLREYRVARAAQDQSIGRLIAVTRVDTVLRAEADEFERAIRSWNQSNDQLASGEIRPEQGTARLATQQAKYLAALDAGQSLERSIAAAVTRTRSRVGALERNWAVATIGLAFLAAAGALMVVQMMRTTHRQSELARKDPLTTLYNRLGFDEFATRELSRARRTGTAITLMAFDLDGFKQVNDQRGHGTGDELLRELGHAIRGAVRNIDVAARLGGDEFAILLPDNRAQPPELAVERVRAAILARLTTGQWPVTLSIGAVTVIGRDIEISEMIRVADKLMYAVKNSGKNAVRHSLLGADG